MPVRQQTHVDKPLTNLSVQYMQDATNFISDKVFPCVPVQKQSDTYFVYNRGDFYRDEARERAAGTESIGSDYDVSIAPPYYCRIWSFHKDVTEAERVNTDVPLNADIDAVDYVTTKILLKREHLWNSEFFKAGVWGEDYTCGAEATDIAAKKIMKWNNPLSTPIEDITKLSTHMLETTGYEPNTLVISPHVFDALKHHEDLIDRIKYTQAGFTTIQLMARAFEVDAIHIAKGVVNTAAKGEKEVIQFIMGKHALLCYVEKRPGLRKPSAGYIFTWVGLEGAGAFGNTITRIPMPWLGRKTERIEGEAAFDMKIVGKDLGFFLNDLVD